MTDDELKEDMDKWFDMLEKVGAGDDKFKEKEADCPFCGGLLTVLVTKSPLNGHLHCACRACHAMMFQ